MSYFSRDFHFQPAKKYHIVSSVNDSALTNRFGTRSHNMFFVRHAANPRNLKFLTGVDGSMICSVKEDSYTLPDKMKKFLRNTLYESPAYDNFFFPKILNDSMPDLETKRTQAVNNFTRKIRMANSEVKSDIDKLSILNKFVNNEQDKKLTPSLDGKISKRNVRNTIDRSKNGKKFDSKSVFWLSPSKTENSELQSNSLILPKLKTLRLNHSNDKVKKQIDNILIKDYKIRNFDSLLGNGTSLTSIKNTFTKM